ncbi:MAG: cytochrome C [Proteobacteria bacterium]|nr:cytochrome C [Pseudomonadota bacterium]MBU1905295.1 cytochrome C [Pseudomonadota bacterium]
MVSVLVAISFSIQAGEFTQEDLKRWDKEFMTVVMKGEKLFHSALGKNKVSCDQCHPNAANTHPETYPKFQQQIGRVVALFEMVNWCIQNPLEGDPLPPEDPKMTALLSYMTYERRGVPLAPGKH